jgi:uncharacterized cupin superfamily protein
LNLLDDAPQRFGEELGATLWGGTLHELAPGDSSSYHWHYGEEECVIALAGRPTLRTPEGERELAAWDIVWFPRGAQGAHQVRNDGDEPARVVFFSTASDPEVVVYPDEGRTGVIAGWSRDDRPTLRGWVEPR